jgi:hypothetical protein
MGLQKEWEMPTDNTELLGELRFAKLQQWAVTTAAITLIAGAFHMAHTVKSALGFYEKVVATVLVALVMLGGIGMLIKLQCHLGRTRKAIDYYDRLLGDRDWRGGS